MNGDGDEYAQSWQRDRLRHPIGRQLQRPLRSGLAVKAGLRSFGGRSIVDDQTPGPRGSGVGSTLLFDEADARAEREFFSARFRSACVEIARVRSSPPCGSGDFLN